MLMLILQDPASAAAVAAESFSVIKYLPESVSVTAVIVVVVLFLRQQSRIDALNRSERELAQKSFEGALERIEASHTDSQEAVAKAIDRLSSTCDRMVIAAGKG